MLGIVISPVSADVHIISPVAGAIQNAITTTAADGDTILLNRGTYTEHDISVTKNITIGANPGDSANSGNTFIDAQGLGRIFNVVGGYNLTIDDLTLRNGRALDGLPSDRFDHTGFAGESGGAISSDGLVTVTSSIIHDCRAGNGGHGYDGTDGLFDPGTAGGDGGNGGAIFTSDEAVINATTITYCYAGNGGRGGTVYNTGTGAKGGDGGAIYAMNFLTITSSSITSCTAGDPGSSESAGGNGGNGGGIYTANYTYPISYMTLGFTTITNCSAGKGGDGFPWYDGGNGGSGGGIYSTWPTTITSSTISSCKATSRGTNTGATPGVDGRGGAYGGFNYGGTLTLENSTLTGNWAPTGGAIGLNDASQGIMRVTSTNISSNSASGWGAIYYWGTLYATSSTFTGNTGGVIEVYLGYLHLNRFYNNTGTTVYCPYDTTLIDARNNWWGTNSNPSGYKYGNVTYSPWLMVCATATPPSISLGETSTIRASLMYNNEGTNASSGGIFVPNAIPIAFAVTGGGGTLDVTAGGTIKGTGTTTFFPSQTGISTIRATVDGQSVDTDVLVPVTARFTGTPVTGLPSLFVQFNDTSDCTAPLTWNWSLGDGTWFNTTNILERNASYTYTVPGDYTVSLTIANAAGSNTTTKTNYINVIIPPPVISGITPITGPANGGTQVNITGTNLAGATSVTFGTGNPATITANTGTAINVTAPSGTLGLVDVTVTTPGGSVTKNNAYTYVPGPATHLTVSAPFHVTTGSSFGITVTALDAMGNTATDYTGTVHFTSSDSAAILPTDYTFVSGDAGTHTFSATLATIGSRTITATDTVTASITGTTGPITLTTTSDSGTDTSGDSGQATSFVASSPGTTAGGTMTFTIGEPLSAGSVDYTYAIATVSIVPTGTLGATDLIVTDAGATSHAPDGRTIAGIVAISPVAVNPSVISSGTITFAVSGAWLSAHGLTPADIVLMRFHDGAWTELPTTYQYDAGGAHYFLATTPGFSYFAITSRISGATAVNASAAATTLPDTIARTTSTLSSSDHQQVTSQKTSAPVAQQTTAVPAAAQVPAGSSGFPVITVALIGTGCVVLVGSGWYIRRWWIRRQNPALFWDYD